MRFFQETFFAIVILLLLIVIANPFHIFMGDIMTMMFAVLLAVAVSIFGLFVWRESARDEREILHRTRAGRSAFLIGGLILSLGIIYQFFEHAIDIWLVVALGSMVIAKAFTSARDRERN